jgi:hypothetical protein
LADDDLKDTERFRGGCWAELDGRLGISLRSFPSTVLDVQKEDVSIEALMVAETFYEMTFTVEVSADEEEDDDLPQEDESANDNEEKPVVVEKGKEVVTYTKLVTMAQSLTFRPVRLPESQVPIIRKLIGIAQATDKLISAEVSVESDEYCDDLRRTLNRAYDNFVEAHGKIRDYRSWFAERNSFWVDYRLVQYALALETEAGQKVDLFYRRQTRPRVVPSGQIFFDEVESDRIVKAFWWCRSYFNNQVDLEQIAEKANSNAEIVEDTLLALGLVDRMPLPGAVIPQAESEDVKGDDDIEAKRQELENHWTPKKAVEEEEESEYQITVSVNKVIQKRQVSGIVGRLGYMAITTKDPDHPDQEDFPLVHLGTGLKACSIKFKARAIACMKRVESIEGLEAFFQETEPTALAGDRYSREKGILAAILREYA